MMQTRIILLFCAVLICVSCSRKREFLALAEKGQPIVKAIETYHQQTGYFPPSLADLSPKYLPQAVEVPDRANHKYEGWDYTLATKGSIVTYELKYYLGRGGVIYKPPNWVGNDEGSMTLILTNQ
jgi:hypothetical protein